jgi:hypothetical protein
MYRVAALSLGTSAPYSWSQERSDENGGQQTIQQFKLNAPQYTTDNSNCDTDYIFGIFYLTTVVAFSFG